MKRNVRWECGNRPDSVCIENQPNHNFGGNRHPAVGDATTGIIILNDSSCPVKDFYSGIQPAQEVHHAACCDGLRLLGIFFPEAPCQGAVLLRDQSAMGTGIDNYSI